MQWQRKRWLAAGWFTCVSSLLALDGGCASFLCTASVRPLHFTELFSWSADTLKSKLVFPNPVKSVASERTEGDHDMGTVIREISSRISEQMPFHLLLGAVVFFFFLFSLSCNIKQIPSHEQSRRFPALNQARAWFFFLPRQEPLSLCAVLQWWDKSPSSNF